MTGLSANGGKHNSLLRRGESQILDELHLFDNRTNVILRRNTAYPEQAQNIDQVYNTNLLLLAIPHCALVIAQQRRMPALGKSNRLTFTQVQFLRILLQHLLLVA